METRTPVTYITNSSGSGNIVRGRHRCVVLCSGNDVLIKTASSPNLGTLVHDKQRHHSAQRRREEADTGVNHGQQEIYRQRARSSPIQPSAPSEQALQRPWSIVRNATGQTSTNEGLPTTIAASQDIDVINVIFTSFYSCHVFTFLYVLIVCVKKIFSTIFLFLETFIKNFIK